MKRVSAGIILVLLLVAPHARAGAQQPGNDPMAEHLFPPELVMKHQREIGLDEAQAKAIKQAMQQAQSRFFELQWDMQPESEKLVQLLQARPVDEAAVLAQADRVMTLERDVKRVHLSLLVRLKNLLREDQQRKLTELRRRAE